MCILFHRFRLTSCEPHTKLFIVKNIINNKDFYVAYNTTWKCIDCHKEIHRRIGKGESGSKSVANFLLKHYNII